MKLGQTRFDLIPEDGETLTFSIPINAGIAELVACALNSKALPIRLLPEIAEVTVSSTAPDKTPDPSSLAVTATYTGTSGGSFRIRVSGNHGGQVSEVDVKQNDGQATWERAYKIAGFAAGHRPG